MNIIGSLHDFIRDHAGSLDDMIYSFPIAVLVAVIYWLVRRVRQKRRFGDDFKAARREARRNEIVRVLFVCYAAGLFCMTLLPTGITGAVWLFFAYFQWLRPFYGFERWWFNIYPQLFDWLNGTITDVHGSLFRYIIGLAENIVLFVPLGFLLPFIWKRANLWRITLLSACVTAVIELIQPFIGRNGDIEDILCNTLGAVIGYLLYVLIKKLFPAFSEKCSKRIDV